MEYINQWELELHRRNHKGVSYKEEVRALAEVTTDILLKAQNEKDKLQAENKKLRDIVTELLESAEYWSEYDVPIGIVDRMKKAIKEQAE